MPVIAIALCSELSDYEPSVTLAGGTTWVIDHLTTRHEDVMGVANGLLLTGGSPVRADQSRAPRRTGCPFPPPTTERDGYEIELVSTGARGGPTALCHLPRHPWY